MPKSPKFVEWIQRYAKHISRGLNILLWGFCSVRNCCHWYRPTNAHIFNVQGSVHCKYIPFDIFPTSQRLIISGKLLCVLRAVSPPIIRSTYNCTYCIWYLLNFTATYLYRGRVGAGLSVVWEFYRLVKFPHPMSAVWEMYRLVQIPHHTQTSSNSPTIEAGSSNS
jgi:hypothetical protein